MGLTGDEDSSGDKEKKLGMTKEGIDFWEKFYRKQLGGNTKRLALLLDYKKYTRSYPSAKAIIKICRKLLNRIRYVIMNEQEYQLQTI